MKDKFLSKFESLRDKALIELREAGSASTLEEARKIRKESRARSQKNQREKNRLNRHLAAVEEVRSRLQRLLHHAPDGLSFRYVEDSDKSESRSRALDREMDRLEKEEEQFYDEEDPGVIDIGSEDDEFDDDDNFDGGDEDDTEGDVPTSIGLEISGGNLGLIGSVVFTVQWPSKSAKTAGIIGPTGEAFRSSKDLTAYLDEEFVARFAEIVAECQIALEKKLPPRGKRKPIVLACVACRGKGSVGGYRCVECAGSGRTSREDHR